MQAKVFPVLILAVILAMVGCSGSGQEEASLPPDDVARHFLENLLQDDLEGAKDYCLDSRTAERTGHLALNFVQGLDISFNYEVVTQEEDYAEVFVLSDANEHYYSTALEKVEDSWKITYILQPCYCCDIYTLTNGNSKKLMP